MCSGIGFCPDCKVTWIEAKLWNDSHPTTKQSPVNPPQAATTVAKSNQICPKCGQTFDGVKCWECVSRKADIEVTVSLCFPVGLAGITLGNILAIAIFPPLISTFPKVYLVPALFFLAAMAAVLMLGQRQTRYANFVRLMVVLVTISLYVPAAYFFLNGMLDSSQAVEVPSRVMMKTISKKGSPIFGVNLEWNQKRIEENMEVSRDTYYAITPGEFVRVVIHPGAFSQPWYDDVLVSTDDTHDPR
jgi:hypothetical protein